LTVDSQVVREFTASGAGTGPARSVRLLRDLPYHSA
jgi:hypothetical protein